MPGVNVPVLRAAKRTGSLHLINFIVAILFAWIGASSDMTGGRSGLASIDGSMKENVLHEQQNNAIEAFFEKRRIMGRFATGSGFLAFRCQKSGAGFYFESRICRALRIRSSLTGTRTMPSASVPT